MSRKRGEKSVPENDTTPKEENGMSMMDEMMESMMGSMSKEERQALMEKMMEKFLADMTAEDKQRMMEQMMPSMMMGMMGGGESGSGMMEMMSQMMGGGEGTGMPMMPQMMTQMMPQCLNMMLPSLPKEERIEFVLNMVTTLMEQGSVGMSDEEKKDFVAKVVEKVKMKL